MDDLLGLEIAGPRVAPACGRFWGSGAAGAPAAAAACGTNHAPPAAGPGLPRRAPAGSSAAAPLPTAPLPILPGCPSSESLASGPSPGFPRPAGARSDLLLGSSSVTAGAGQPPASISVNGAKFGAGAAAAPGGRTRPCRRARRGSEAPQWGANPATPAGQVRCDRHGHGVASRWLQASPGPVYVFVTLVVADTI